MLYCNNASPFHLVSIKRSKIHVLFDAAEANFFILHFPPGAVLFLAESLWAGSVGVNFHAVHNKKHGQILLKRMMWLMYLAPYALLVKGSSEELLC